MPARLLAATPRLSLHLALLTTLAVSACSSSGDDGYDGRLDAPAGVYANPAITATDTGWTAVENAARYIVTARASGQADVSTSVTAPATGVRVSGLQADTDYSLTVQAVDADGDVSESSSAVTVHTPRLINTAAERDAYNAAADYSDTIGGHAVVVVRDGQIVFERYSNGHRRAQSHVLASGTKSFSCAFMLAAEQDGYLTRDQNVSSVLTEWQSDPNKSRMTVRQLLSLQGGLSTNPDYSPIDVAEQDTYQLALDDPANFAPGSAFIYDPLAFQAFALMFERRSGGTDPVAYLQDKVFEPIGLSGDEWQRDANDKPQMAGGASMTAEAWARYGQMMLQGGSWQTQRILPADGVDDCLHYRNEAYLGYGITWWLNRPVEGSYDPSVDQIPVDGQPVDGYVAPGAPEDMVMAAGVGHQRLYLLPSQRLVVVRFAALETETDSWSDGEFLSRLLGSASGG